MAVDREAMHYLDFLFGPFPPWKFWVARTSILQSLTSAPPSSCTNPQAPTLSPPALYGFTPDRGSLRDLVNPYSQPRLPFFLRPLRFFKPNCVFFPAALHSTFLATSFPLFPAHEWPSGLCYRSNVDLHTPPPPILFLWMDT